MSQSRRTKPKAPQVTGYKIGRKVDKESEVYAATKSSTGRKVVVKLPSIDMDGYRELDRFYREVKVLAALDHPSIVSIMDAGETTSGVPFFVRPFISGQTFEKYLFPGTRKSLPDIREQLRLFCKISVSLQGVHERGVVHRNLKPANILVDDREEPHILDFGIAFLPKERHKELRVGIGSPPWMSPEQVRFDPTIFDTRSDIFALGSILYYVLTEGSVPFPDSDKRSDLTRILKDDPVPLESTRLHSLQMRLDRAGVDKPGATANALQAITLKALAKSPAERYQTVQELAFEIRSLIEPAPSPNESQLTKTILSSLADGNRLASRDISMQWPGLEAVKAVYDRLPGRPAHTGWELLPKEKQFQIAQTMIEIALNAPKAADDITRILVLHAKMEATIQRVPDILQDLAQQIRTAPWSSIPSPKSLPSKADEDEELQRIWHNDLGPIQKAILKFMRNKADNLLNFARIADNIKIPRLPLDPASNPDRVREISDKSVKNYCLPMFKAPLSLIKRVGDRGVIHLTEKGNRLIQLASRDFS